MTDLEQGTGAGGASAPAEPAPHAEQVPTADERTLATLAHVLQLVGWFIAPLIIFFIRRESRFVSFHALQAIFLQLAYMVFWVCFAVLWFAAFILGAAFSGGKSEPPVLILVLFPVIWLFGMGMWLGLLVTAIVYGIKAGKGEWAAYPVIGRWARRVLNE